LAGQSEGFAHNNIQEPMQFTGERYVPTLTGPIKYEHLHRYAIASQLTPGKDVLDLACGEGYGTSLLARTAASAVGVDNSAEAINYASRRYTRSNLSFVLGTCYSIPLSTGSVDVVASFETIEHHDKPEEMMREVRRVLRPNGLLVISTPDRLTYSDQPSYTNPFHVREFYYDEFRSLLKKYFGSVEIYGQRLASASFVHSLEDAVHNDWVAYTGDVAHLAPGTCTLPSPVYFVALCSDDRREVESRAFRSVYVDPGDDVLKQLGTEWLDKVRQLEAAVHNQESILAQGEIVLAQEAVEITRMDQERLALQEKVAGAQKTVGNLRRERDALTDELTVQERAVAKSTQTLNQIYASRGWKALSVYYRLRDKLLPKGLRRGVAKALWVSHIVWEGSRLFRDMRLITASGLFDRDWYLQNNPDVAETGVDPLIHYLRRGAREGRNPGPAFNSKQYLQEYPDVARSRVNPLAHYLRSRMLRGNAECPTVRLPAMRSHDVPPTVNDPIFQDSDMDTADERNWEERKALRLQISALRQAGLKKFPLEVPSVVMTGDNDVADIAKSLIFPVEDQVEVSIVIPVFNNLKFTLECLTSVIAHSSGTRYEVVVIDVGSSDRTPEILSRVDNMVYVKQEKNTGFLHSCNRGAERARGEYIVFLNNDAQVTEGWLRPLLTTLKENADVGAVGPKILHPNGRLQEAGRVVNRDGTSQMVGLFDDPKLPRYNYPREVMYCSGACLLVSARTFREVGGFDTDFDPAYCEDCDLSFRLRERGLRVLYNPQSVVIHHLGVTCNGLDEGLKIQAVFRNRQKLSAKWQRQIDELNKIRVIAVYLPQYHPIPENDRWWGKGFTEWTNVAKARPNFLGHYQPHVPADLGFYDLRVENVMEEQADLARRYGIHGFCYYYYWFAGKRLLEMPLDRMLETGKPDFPFCIAWANENWTRRWDGREHEVLLAQQHSEDDDRAVLNDMMRYLKHPNYIRINGKPLLIVYRINLFPDIKRTAEIWRDLCRRGGIGEVYLAFAESFEQAAAAPHPCSVGFDASVEFPPHRVTAPISPPGRVLNPQYRGAIHDYEQVVLKYLQLPVPGHVRFRTVMPSWDNTPRSQNNSIVYANTSPGAYQAWLEAIIQQTHEQNFGDERIVFVSAWNEWAEGNHLEPDQQNGHAFLQATRDAQDAWLLDQVGDRVD
jgi:GT2 family glycosyltransferase/ubiquinone/menaquinone biosynthesis C-methylase UbiE